jgi:hypothetical protein
MEFFNRIDPHLTMASGSSQQDQFIVSDSLKALKKAAADCAIDRIAPGQRELFIALLGARYQETNQVLPPAKSCDLGVWSATLDQKASIRWAKGSEAAATQPSKAELTDGSALTRRRIQTSNKPKQACNVRIDWPRQNETDGSISL